MPPTKHGAGAKLVDKLAPLQRPMEHVDNPVRWATVEEIRIIDAMNAKNRLQMFKLQIDRTESLDVIRRINNIVVAENDVYWSGLNLIKNFPVSLRSFGGTITDVPFGTNPTSSPSANSFATKNILSTWPMIELTTSPTKGLRAGYVAMTAETIIFREPVMPSD